MIKVEYFSGNSRGYEDINDNGNPVVCRANEPCDYMIADIEDSDGKITELYAEVYLKDYGAPVDGSVNDMNEWYNDGNELITYCDLKAMIQRQAKEQGINLRRLHFIYD